MHEIIDNDKLFSERIGATRLYDALADWFLNGTRYTVTAACANFIATHVYERLCRAPSRAGQGRVGQGCHRGQWRAWRVGIMTDGPQMCRSDVVNHYYTGGGRLPSSEHTRADRRLSGGASGAGAQPCSSSTRQRPGVGGLIPDPDGASCPAAGGRPAGGGSACAERRAQEV